MRTYDPLKVSFTFLGIAIKGFAKGTMIKVSRNSDNYKLAIGSQGEGCRTRSQDKSGTIEITLMASSPSNDYLSACVDADDLNGSGVGTGMVKDAGGTALASAQNAWVRKIADLERGEEHGDVTWIFESDSVAIQQGGTIDTPNAATGPSVP